MTREKTISIVSSSNLIRGSMNVQFKVLNEDILKLKNYKKIMNYIIYIVTLCVFLPTQIMGMYTTFYKPSYWQEKPRYDRYNLTTYEFSYSHSWASKSFNKDGDRVPLLAFSGPEPLLPSFVDCDQRCDHPCKIDCRDNKPVCYGIFDGEFTLDSLHHEFVQNIHKHCFLDIVVNLSHAHLKNICVTPTDACGKKIPRTEEINTYLKKFFHKFIGDQNPGEQERVFLGPCFVLLGYTRSYENFKHADVFDFSFRTGFIIPVHDFEHPDFSLYPRTDQIDYGIPAQIEMSAGFFDWLNVGGSFTVIAFMKRDDIVDINKYPYPNRFIVPTAAMSGVLHHPQVACNVYIEGENLVPYWSWFIGFSFIKQFKTVWDVCDDKSANHIANQFPVHLPWQQGSITLSSEFSFSSEEKKCMPRLKIMYIKRIFGKSCFDTAVIAGQIGLDFIWNF